MTGLVKNYGTNKDAENNGTPIPFEDAENDDGTIPTFIVARASKTNTAYTKALDLATRPYRRQIELKTFKNDDADRIMLDVFLSTVLKGWDNVQDAQGNSIGYSPEAARKLMTEYPDIYARLNEESGNRVNYTAAIKEEEAKN